MNCTVVSSNEFWNLFAQFVDLNPPLFGTKQLKLNINNASYVLSCLDVVCAMSTTQLWSKFRQFVQTQQNAIISTWGDELYVHMLESIKKRYVDYQQFEIIIKQNIYQSIITQTYVSDQQITASILEKKYQAFSESEQVVIIKEIIMQLRQSLKTQQSYNELLGVSNGHQMNKMVMQNYQSGGNMQQYESAANQPQFPENRGIDKQPIDFQALAAGQPSGTQQGKPFQYQYIFQNNQQYQSFPLKTTNYVIRKPFPLVIKRVNDHETPGDRQKQEAPKKEGPVFYQQQKLPSTVLLPPPVIKMNQFMPAIQTKASQSLKGIDLIQQLLMDDKIKSKSQQPSHQKQRVAQWLDEQLVNQTQKLKVKVFGPQQIVPQNYGVFKFPNIKVQPRVMKKEQLNLRNRCAPLIISASINSIYQSQKQQALYYASKKIFDVSKDDGCTQTCDDDVLLVKQVQQAHNQRITNYFNQQLLQSYKQVSNCLGPSQYISYSNISYDCITTVLGAL